MQTSIIEFNGSDAEARNRVNLTMRRLGSTDVLEATASCNLVDR